ncbi:MAG: SUMF1/EgtB/PvdO family nonheme iron enzyme [Deltaproteobacteria bacterium]|nr:SUMF1/EgtB/PvdO family nonheme iron enzyme [Deltaproteobacteria bacterium]
MAPGERKPDAQADSLGTPRTSAERPTESGVQPTVMAAAGAIVAAPDAPETAAAFYDELAAVEDIAALPAQVRYAPVGELGRGGMGRVDVVFDRLLGRPVAQKKVLEAHNDRYLVSEGQIGAQLEHPSIVPVYDLGADAEGRPFYTMRVVNGRALSHILYDEHGDGAAPLGLSKLLGILRQVCLAVDYAHSRGVVHRDLKPDNIVVGAFGEVYVLDWGVACVTDDSDIRQSERMPGSEAVAGTPGYMAPEQALAEPVDGRTDVFALGVILHEIFTGQLPFDDEDLHSVVRRATEPDTLPPPSLSGPRTMIPAPFDALVRSCLRRDPKHRPLTARFIADAIDGYLDAERARSAREKEAAEHVREGRAAWSEHERLDDQAVLLRREAEAMLGELEPWQSANDKQPGWDLAERARRLGARAAQLLAQAETAFARALGRVPDHAEARESLATLYYREFEKAEAEGNEDRMAQHLELARSYDDGSLALELADQGSLTIEVVPPAQWAEIARYEPTGPLLCSKSPQRIALPAAPLMIDSGSYLITTQCDGEELRYPLLIRRAKVHRLRIRMPRQGLIPHGMCHVPAGPYLCTSDRGHQLRQAVLPGFALGRFPVTLREYARFLDCLDDAERHARTPVTAAGGNPLIERRGGEDWVLTDEAVEGEGRRRIAGRELELPVVGVSWYDAVAYTEWLARETGVAYRLPTAQQWEKGMRGADGRQFPMGDQLDPSFAKLRQSRPEGTQLETVGSFPLDSSPFGVRDLAGGVCDWTATSLDGAPLPELTAEGQPEADERRAIYLGGHWGGTTSVRGRHDMSIKHRTNAVGFRLALTLDPEQSSELIVKPMKR